MQEGARAQRKATGRRYCRSRCSQDIRHQEQERFDRRNAKRDHRLRESEARGQAQGRGDHPKGGVYENARRPCPENETDDEGREKHECEDENEGVLWERGAGQENDAFLGSWRHRPLEGQEQVEVQEGRSHAKTPWRRRRGEQRPKAKSKDQRSQGPTGQA